MRAQWLEDRQVDLIPVDYFHVVFTLLEEIATIAYQNKAVVYDILFHATAETLSTIAADSRHLGSEIDFTLVCFQAFAGLELKSRDPLRSEVFLFHTTHLSV